MWIDAKALVAWYVAAWRSALGLVLPPASAGGGTVSAAGGRSSSTSSGSTGSTSSSGTSSGRSAPRRGSSTGSAAGAAAGGPSSVMGAAAQGPVDAPEPVGWFSALVVHGGATLGAICDYMNGGGSGMFMPFLQATYDPDSFNNEGDGATVYDGGFHKEHCELMPPCLPGCGPVFFNSGGEETQHHMGGDGHDYKALLDVAVTWMADHVSPTAIRVDRGEDETFNSPYRNEPGADGVCKTDVNEVEPPNFPFQLEADGTPYMIGYGVDPLTGAFGQTKNYLRPARGVREWIQGMRFTNDSGDVDGSRWNWTRWGDTGDVFELRDEVIGRYLSERVKVPSYYRGTAGLRDEWWGRLLRWYHRAAFLVWAAEMWRCHGSHTKTTQPDWWIDHCQAWGVGNVSDTNRSKYPPVSSLLHSTDADDVWTILHLVVKHAPPPGSPGTLGEQIVPRTTGADGRALFKRALLDLPENAGSVDPPYSVQSVGQYGVERFARWAASKAAGQFDWASTIISLEVALCSAGFASAITTPIAAGVTALAGGGVSNFVCKVVSLALQAAFRMGTGGAGPISSWGDVVGLAGEAVAACGLGDSLKTIPSEVWEAVKNVGALIPQVSGADNDALQVLCGGIQSTFDLLDKAGWPYIEQAYGGLGMAKTAMGKAEDNGDPKTNLF